MEAHHDIATRRSDPDCNAEPAVQFLAISGRHRQWPERSEDELRAIVEDSFLRATSHQAGLDEFAALLDTSSPSDPRAMQVALRVVQEWRLVAWTRSLNYDKGVSLSTEAVLQRLEQARLSLPEAARPAPRGTVDQGAARIWAARWRRRWGGRHGQIRAREAISLDDMRSKALPQTTTVCT